MEANYIIHQEAAQNMNTGHSEVYDDGTIMFEPEFPNRNSIRKRNKGILYRIRHGSATEYLIVIAVCAFIILALSIALGKARCKISTPFSKGKATKFDHRVYKSKSGETCPYQNIRLPDNVLPRVYKIRLTPKLSKIKSTFSGWVIIECECMKSVDFIVFHSKELQLKKIEVSTKRVGLLEVVSTSECVDLEEVYVKLNTVLQKGDLVKLKIHFEGEILKVLDGFYLSDYIDGNGTNRQLATTHMEPTSARKAFPCFDEPAMKANFSMEMERDSNHRSLFNMPLNKTEPLGNNRYLDVYDESVKMSTYLVAFMLLPNDYKFVSGESPNGKVKINVHVPSKMIKSAEFAVDVTKKVLPFFENFFSQPYPLPKLDMIGVPDFGAGAMENWGLVTYRFITLLYSKESGQVQNAQSVAEVISHEIAHQWFGNIVTMKWWNDLWLNEGFATFTQYMAAQHFSPDWKMMDQFYLNNFYQAMVFDCLIHSHPVPVPVENPTEIESLFDDISYFKSASLLRMLESVVGMESLKAGLKIYLQRFRFRNAANEDLWAAITEGYKLTNGNKFISTDSPMRNLTRVMSTWLDQMNFPTVQVTMLDSTTFKLSQSRFLLYKDSVKLFKSQFIAPYGYLWSIPVKYFTDTNKDVNMVWLDLKKEQTYKLPKAANWIKINYEQTGYYITNYETSLWRKIIAQLKQNHSVFSATDRAGLINDAFRLVRSGDINITIALDLLSYLKKETDYAPWKVALKKATYVENIIYFDYELHRDFQKYMQALVKPVLDLFETSKMSWNNKDLSHMQILTRNTVFQFAINFKETSAIKKALSLFQQFKQTSTIEDSNLKDLIYYTGIKEGSVADWEFIWERYSKETEPQEKRSLRKALSATQDARLIHRLLTYTLNPKKIRTQDAVFLIIHISKSAVGRDLAWIFIRRYWSHFSRTYGGQAFLMAELLKLTNQMSTEFDYQTCKEFFESNDLGSGKRSSQQALEYIKSNILWMLNNYRIMQNWCSNNEYHD